MKTLLTFIMGFGLIISSFANETNDTATAGPILYTRHFKVSDSFPSHLQHLLPPKRGESNQDLLLRFLKTQKIEFEKPAFLNFDEAGGKLIVRSTLQNLDYIENLIYKLK